MKQIINKIHKVTSKVKESGYWYDNPNISDLLFGFFSVGKSLGVCLQTYDRITKKGLNNFRKLNDGSWTADVIETLQDQIVYEPILTISTTNADFIENHLNEVLDGIDGITTKEMDNYGNGIPKIIFIPVLMHTNHFGVLAIIPTPNSTQKAKVHFFNPLGTGGGYKNEEVLICRALIDRYNLEVGEDLKGENLVLNNSDRWQNDGNQCGPYAIWFITTITKLIEQGKELDITRLLKKPFHMGNANDKGRALALEHRAEHAKYVEGLTTDITPQIFWKFKQMVREIHDWFNKEFAFEVVDGKHEKVDGQSLRDGKTTIREVDKVDTFELHSFTGAVALEKDHPLRLTKEQIENFRFEERPTYYHQDNSKYAAMVKGSSSGTSVRLNSEQLNNSNNGQSSLLYYLYNYVRDAFTSPLDHKSNCAVIAIPLGIIIIGIVAYRGRVSNEVTSSNSL